MNRDERRDRHEKGVYSDANRFFPLDGQSGGTWCGVNSHGLGLALLNRYHDDTGSGSISRGGIVPTVLQTRTLEQAVLTVQGLELTHYNPFTLLLLSATEALRFIWDGTDNSIGPLCVKPWSMLSSSSWQMERVLASRQQRFENWAANAEAGFGVVPELHLSETNWAKSDSILMERADTHTKSISQFSLQHHHVGFNYYDQTALQALRLNSFELPTHSSEFVIL